MGELADFIVDQIITESPDLPPPIYPSKREYLAYLEIHFVWRTKQGEHLEIDQIEPEHLRNIIGLQKRRNISESNPITKRYRSYQVEFLEKNLAKRGREK